MVGEDAIDGDVCGDDGDNGRGALIWGTCRPKCLAVWVHAPLFLPNYSKYPLFFVWLGFDRISSMSSSIFNGVKDEVCNIIR